MSENCVQGMQRRPRESHRMARRKQPAPPRPCIQCSKNFSPWKIDAQYCSSACWQKTRRKRGLCERCKELKTIGDKRFCATHREQVRSTARLYMRRRNERRRLAGVCKDCLQPAQEGFTRCFKHRQRYIKAKWKRRLTRFDALVDKMHRKGYIPIFEAAETGIKASTLYYHCGKGNIKAVKLGKDRRWWVKKASLQAMITGRSKSQRRPRE